MKVRGFSLMEMMIVVAIVLFLAAVSLPTFMRFLAKAKRTEAYINLRAMYAAQKMYWAEHGRYTTTLYGQDGIGWQPEGYHGGGERENFYYTYGFSQGGEGKQFFTGKLGASSSHLSRSYADENSFLICAAGDIDGDGKVDIIAIDHRNVITILEDDLI